jgi:hypothetical protein
MTEQTDFRKLLEAATQYADAIKAYREACGVGVILDSATVMVAAFSSDRPEAVALEAARTEYRKLADPRLIIRLLSDLDAAVNALPEHLARIAELEAALTEVVGCFDAASCEGLATQLWAGGEFPEVGDLRDLVMRRLLPAADAARAALSGGKP